MSANKSVTTKIGWLLSIMMLVVAAMVGINVVLSNKVKGTIHVVNTHDAQVNSLANQANNAFLNMDDQSNMWLGLRTFKNVNLSQTTHRQILPAKWQVDSALKQLASVATSPAIKQLTQTTQKDAVAYENFFSQVEKDYTTDPAQANQIMFVTSATASNALTNDLVEFPKRFDICC